ncbi:MAG: tyrosine-protein phosphatase [Bacillota bacterium]
MPDGRCGTWFGRRVGPVMSGQYGDGGTAGLVIRFDGGLVSLTIWGGNIMGNKKMIDIHSHILPGLDDGVESRQEALKAIKNLMKDDISGLIATPHTGQDRGIEPERVKEEISKLQTVLEQEKLDFMLYPGAELAIYPRLGRDIEKGKVLSLNEGSYLLVELPGRFIPDFRSDVFYDLRVMGYKTILCHPERNTALIKNPEYLYDWLEKGLYVQLNAGSLLGFYGRKVKNVAEIFVRKKYVQLMASDLHSGGRRSECMGTALRRVRELAGPEMVELFQKNSWQVVKDGDLERFEPERITGESLLGWIKDLFA